MKVHTFLSGIMIIGLCLGSVRAGNTQEIFEASNDVGDEKVTTDAVETAYKKSDGTFDHLKDVKRPLPPKLRNVYGYNERNKVIEFNNSLSQIGKLRKPRGGGYCTASLVGENLILTAAHCIIKDGKLITGDYLFYTGLRGGFYEENSAISYFWWGSKTPDDDQANDWAILQLKTPLGKKVGYFGTRTIPTLTSENNFGLTIAGYSPINKTTDDLYVQEGCSVREHLADGTLFYHDCDAGPGDSGGPIYKCTESSCFIVAIHVAAYQHDSANALWLREYDRQVANIAVSNKKFGAKISELRR